MSLDEDFSYAQERVHRLARRPSTHELLELYALYKQATAGDVSGKRPSRLDFKGRAKYDAWATRKGQAPEACMRDYIELVMRLEGKYGRG
jgi:acyl-CoA-binding protein